MIRKQGRTARRLRKLLRRFHTPAYADNFGVLLPVKHPLISPGIGKEICLGDYERKEAEIVTQRLEAGDVVMEIGAGIGFLSAYCAKRIGGERVFAYEANPALMEVIRDTYAVNGVTPSLRNVMLAEGAGTARFFVEEEFWASTTVREATRNAREIEVEQVDLNREIARVQPTFLIVDIEGGEADLFPLADLSGVQKICVETHPHTLGNGGVSRLLALLFERGFVLDISLIRKNVFFLYRPGAGRAP
ncbi:MAG: FkbM family methyltransferase [Rhodocyclaceae bacterium]|nr:FkbM family methyltransferase [Rhodocyclaceae bacterium]MBX3669576.1 FkbM family methyltransferase [Rhodocyclaceae bacterium]